MATRRLVERERQLAELQAAIAATAAGAPQVVAVSGLPGVGKSALLAEAVRSARRAELNVLRATAARGGPSFSVVRELLAPATGSIIAGVSPGADIFTTLHTLFLAVAELTERSPVAVVIDDAHWLDASSARWIEHMLERIEDLPLLVIIASRPGAAVTHALGRLPQARRLGLTALSPAGVAAVVGSDLADRVHALTAGNPLMVRTLAAALAAGELTPEALHASQPPLDAARFGELADARLARLGAGAEELAAAVATLGAGCALRDAAAVARLEMAAAGAARDLLVDADVLVSAPRLEFVHPLLEATVVGRQPATARSDRHARAFAQLRAIGAPAEHAARHLLVVEPAGDPAIADALAAGARAALAGGAPEAALELLLRALEEPPRPAALSGIHELLADAGFRCGHSRTADWSRRAVELACTLPERARAALRMSNLVRLQGGVGAEFGALLPDPDEVGRDDPDLGLQLRAGICAAAVATPSRRQAVTADRTALARADLVGQGPGERAALALLAMEALMCGEPSGVVADLSRRALGDGDPAGIGALETWPYWYAVLPLAHAGHPREALALLDRTVDSARARGSLVALELACVHRAYTRLLLGDVHGAELDAIEAMDSSTAHGWTIGRGARLGYATRALLQRGDVAGAGALIRGWEDDPPARTQPWYGSTDELTWYEAMYLEGRGRFELWTGHAEAALGTFRAIGAGLSRDWTSGRYFTWRVGATRALVVLGETGEAAELADEELRRAREAGDARTVGIALRTAGLAHGDVALLTEAVAMLAPAPLERAWALFDLGVVLRRARRAVEAREPLGAARDWAGHAGARLLHDRATEELVAAGARPRRDVLSGVEALTARERHVAALAAAGLSNPEIAQRLFVTRKTVEAHLGRVYMKLDVTRDGLADTLSG